MSAIELILAPFAIGLTLYFGLLFILWIDHLKQSAGHETGTILRVLPGQLGAPWPHVVTKQKSAEDDAFQSWYKRTQSVEYKEQQRRAVEAAFAK